MFTIEQIAFDIAIAKQFIADAIRCRDVRKAQAWRERLARLSAMYDQRAVLLAA